MRNRSRTAERAPRRDPAPPPVRQVGWLPARHSSLLDDRLELAIGIAALVGLVVGCLLVLRPFLSALLWGAILAYSTWPLYRRLAELLGGRRGIAAFLMTLLLATAFVLPLVLVGSSAADGASQLLDSLRRAIENGPPTAPAWLTDLPLAGGILGQIWHDVVTNTRSLVDLLQPYLTTIRDVAIKAGIGVGGGLVEVTLSVVAAFFFYRDGVSVVTRAGAVGRRIAGDRYEPLLEVVGGTIRGVVYGIVGTAIAQAVLAAIGFWIAGIPGAFVLAFITFFLALLPMGPPLIWIPVTIWLFSEGAFAWAIFMALWGSFVISGVDNFLKPWLISRGSSLSFLLVFVGVIGGALAFGFLGIFLGPVLLALGWAVIRDWALAEEEAHVGPPAPEQ